MRALPVLAGAISIMSAAFPAAAETVTADGRHFELPVPAEHCALSRTDSLGGRFYRQQERIQPSSNRVLIFSVHCNEMALARAGQNVETYSMWLSIRYSRSRTGVPAEFSLQQVLREMERAWPKLDVGRLSELIAKRARNVANLNLGIENLGVLGSDDNAVYVGMIGHIRHANGEESSIAGIMAQTMIGHRIFAFNSYRAFTGAGAFDGMLAEAKRIAAEAQTLNRPAAPAQNGTGRPVAALRPEMTGMLNIGWIAGFAGTLAGIAVCMIGWLSRRQ